MVALAAFVGLGLALVAAYDGATGQPVMATLEALAAIGLLVLPAIVSRKKAPHA